MFFSTVYIFFHIQEINLRFQPFKIQIWEEWIKLARYKNGSHQSVQRLVLLPTLFLYIFFSFEGLFAQSDGRTIPLDLGLY